MSFNPVLFTEACQDVPAEPRWLIQHFLVQGSLGVLAGDPKAGKSELTYQAVAAVATGQPFLGFASTQGGVLIMVAEEARAEAIQRLRHFKLPTDARVWLWTDAVIDTIENHRAIGRFLQATPEIKLIVIDTLASYLMFHDETDNSHVTARLKPYVDLAHNSGVTILFVHHQRKNRDDSATSGDVRTVRGGTAITALADVIYQLQHMHGGPTTRRLLKIASRAREMPTSLSLDYPSYPEGGYIRL